MVSRNIVRGVIPLNPVVAAWADMSDVDPDEGEAYSLDGYSASRDEDSPYIVITQSPYYTLCRPCSPCYPNAGDLDSPDERGRETFCFGPGWFDCPEGCPYPVFRVEDDTPVWRTDAEEHIWLGVLQGLAFTYQGEEGEEKPEVEAGAVWALLDDTERFLLISDVQGFYHEIKGMELPWGENGPDDAFWEKVGVNFHLTRNGHGAGFWDLGWGDVGDTLTELCRPYSTCELMVWGDEASGDLSGEICH